MSGKTILSFGEVLWDILAGSTILGGAPLNLACRLVELGDRGVIVSRVGADKKGKRAIRQINCSGMDTTYIQQDCLHPTGENHISFDEKCMLFSLGFTSRFNAVNVAKAPPFTVSVSIIFPTVKFMIVSLFEPQ